MGGRHICGNRQCQLCTVFTVCSRIKVVASLRRLRMGVDERVNDVKHPLQLRLLSGWRRKSRAVEDASPVVIDVRILASKICAKRGSSVVAPRSVRRRYHISSFKMICITEAAKPSRQPTRLAKTYGKSAASRSKIFSCLTSFLDTEEAETHHTVLRIDEPRFSTVVAEYRVYRSIFWDDQKI